MVTVLLQGTVTAFIVQQDNPTINLTIPNGWGKLDNHQLRYVFGLLAQGIPLPQIKTNCLFRWTGMQVIHDGNVQILGMYSEKIH